MNNKPDKYIAGACNIGEAEIAKRKRGFLISALVTAALTLAGFYFYESLLFFLLLLVSSGFTILEYLQVKNRFCVFFGFLGKYNFQKLNSFQKINDKEQVAKDRLKVLVIGMQATLFSLLYTVLIYILTTNFHF